MAAAVNERATIHPGREIKWKILENVTTLTLYHRPQTPQSDFHNFSSSLRSLTVQVGHVTKENCKNFRSRFETCKRPFLCFIKPHTLKIFLTEEKYNFSFLCLFTLISALSQLCLLFLPPSWQLLRVDDDDGDIFTIFTLVLSLILELDNVNTLIFQLQMIMKYITREVLRGGL